MQTKKHAIFDKRLTKADAKNLVKARQERKAFVGRVLAAKPTPESVEKAGELVRKVRDAKNAAFLGQYRRTVVR